MAAPERPASSTPDLPPYAASLSAVQLVLEGPLEPADVPVLLARVRAAAAGMAQPVVACDVERVGTPDIGTVGVLARLALAVQRAGGRVRIEHASPELSDLVVLSGLARVLRCVALPLEAVGKPEEREEARRVEEERDPRDPTL